MADRKATRAAYHHGDLPDRLMCLALQHIRCHGTQKLSLRALAREAGVSPTAPYRHFPTKQCLLAALATQGFRELQTRTEAAACGAETLEGKFLAMGSAYVQFAQDNPTTYQLMFGSVLGDFSTYDMLHNAAHGAYSVVDELLVRLVAEKALSLDADQLAGMVWAALHGIASLLISELESAAHSPRPMRSLAALRADPRPSVEYTLRALVNANRH